MASAARRVFVADGGSKHTLTFLNLATGKREKVVQLKSVSWQNALATSPDGKMLVVTEVSQGPTFVDASTGAVVKMVECGNVTSVAWSADGKHVAAGTGGSEVALIDPSTFEVVTKIHAHQGEYCAVNTAAFSPSSKLLVSGAIDCTAIIYSAHDLSVRKKLEGHADRINCAVFIDEDRVATGSHDNTIRIWNALSGETIHTIKEHNGFVSAFEVSPDGKVLVSGGADKKLCLYDAKTYAVTRTVQCEGSVWSLCFVDNGTLLAGVLESEILSVDVHTGEATKYSKEGTLFGTKPKKFSYPSIVVAPK